MALQRAGADGGEKMIGKNCFWMLGLTLFILASVGSLPTNAFSQNQPAYIIGAGDVLEITTWKEPDFSRPEVLVRTDGKITFTLLNDIQAAGLTPMQLKKEIESGLIKYVKKPIVTVTVKDPASQKIYILGEVLHTGEYPLLKDLTVLQAFALAGGFTEWASKKEIMLIRRVDGKEKIYRINYKNIVKGEDLKQNIHLKANDTVIVP